MASAPPLNAYELTPRADFEALDLASDAESVDSKIFHQIAKDAATVRSPLLGRFWGPSDDVEAPSGLAGRLL